MTIPNTPKHCKFCGKKLETRKRELFGGSVIETPIPCSCDESVAAIMYEQEQEKHKKRQAQQKALEERFERAGIRKRFIPYQLRKEALELYDTATTQGLYIHGQSGRRKSTLACDIAKLAIEKKLKVYFINAPSLIDEIKATYTRNSDLTEDDVIRRFSKCDLLVLDDLGQEKPTPTAIEVIYKIVNERDLDMLPTIVTSNFPRNKLIEMLSVGGSKEKALAIVSRLGGLQSYEMQGKDYRLG